MLPEVYTVRLWAGFNCYKDVNFKTYLQHWQFLTEYFIASSALVSSFTVQIDASDKIIIRNSNIESFHWLMLQVSKKHSVITICNWKFLAQCSWMDGLFPTEEASCRIYSGCPKVGLGHNLNMFWALKKTFGCFLYGYSFKNYLFIVYWEGRIQ